MSRGIKSIDQDLCFSSLLSLEIAAEVLEMHRAGTLTPLLMDAGAIANNSAQLNII